MTEYKITVDNSLIGGTSKAEHFWNDGHDGNTLNAGAGNDTINNTGKYVYIDAGAGNDTVYNRTTADGDGGEYTTIYGGAGNDSLKNHSSIVAVYGDAGDDIIINDAAAVTLRGGAGNDTINLPGGIVNKHEVLIRYGEGDGNDIIIGFGKETEGEVFDTLQLLDEVDIVGGWIADNKSDVVLQVGTGGEATGTITLTKVAGEYSKQINIVRGNDLDEEYVETKTFESKIITNDEDDWVEGDVLNDFIENNVEEVTIEGKGGGDYITNNGERASVNGNFGDDNIINYANRATLNGDEGNDTISNYGASVVANGGADDDYITNEGAKAKLNGDAGNDFIVNSGANATITGGAGNDTVSLGAASRIQYANGDGNDVIFGYDETSTIKITGGTYNVNSNGLDEVIKVGSGSITVKDANGKNIIIVGADGKAQTVSGGKFDSINNEDGIVFKGNANVNRLSNTGDYVTVNALGGDDVIQNEGDYVSISGGDGNDYIYDKSYNGPNTINAGDGNDTIRFADTSARHTVEYVGGNDVIDGFTENDVLKIVSGGIDLENPEVDGDDVIFTTDNGTLTFKGGRGVQITIVDADGEETSDIYGPITVSNLTDSKIDGTRYNDTLGNFADRATIKGDAGDDLIVNEGALARIDAGAGNDSVTNSGVKATILGGAGDDYIFNSGANANIQGGAGADRIINAGRRATIDGGAGDDYIEGTDEYAEVFVFKGGNGNDQIVNFGAGDSLQISGSIVGRGSVEGGDYVVTVKSGSTENTVTLKDVGSKKFTLDGNTLRLTNSIVPTSLIETVNSEDGVSFSAPEAEDKRYYMINTGDNVTVRTSGANDVVEGSDLYGEVFQFGYTDGNDTILNFRANDTIQAVNGNLSFETADNDVIVSIAGSNKTAKVTLQGAAGLNIRKSGSNYLIGSEPVNEIDNRENDAKVIGTDGADWITNSYANATIDGKGGNDTIEGSTFGEVIMFGATDGKDVVTSFGDNDSIKINMGNVEAMTKVGDDYIINVRSAQYSGSITLKDAFKDDPKRRFKLDGTVITDKQANQIINREDDKKVRGTSDEDYIMNSGQNATIKPGAGNDTVELGSAYAEMIEFSNLDDENIVLNFDTTDTIHATSGTLSAGKSGDDLVVTIKSGTGSSIVRLVDAGDLNASIDSTKTYLRVKPDEVVPIINDRDSVKFSGTADADYMINTYEGVTIQGNKGDDTITGSDEYGEVFLVASNHGQDVITNFGKNDTLKSTAGTIKSFWEEGDDVIVSLQGVSYKETIRLQNAAGYKFVKDGHFILTVEPDIETVESTDDGQKLMGSTPANTQVFIINHDKVTVEGKGGQDTIYASNQPDTFRVSSQDLNGNVIIGFGEDDTIQKIAGNKPTWATVEGTNDVLVSIKGASFAGDYLLKDVADKNYQWVYKNNCLYVDAKHDITVGGNKERVTGTGGRDYIINPDYENVTIQANGGTDTIVGSEAYGEVFVFNPEDGSNLIQQFEAKDTLIAGKGTLSGAVSGDDYIITIEGNGEDSIATVTLEGAAGLEFIQNGATLEVVQPLEPIYNYTDGILFNANSDKGVHMINSGAFVSMQAGGGNDTMEGSDAYGEMFLISSANGNNVITNFGANDSLKMTQGTLMSWAADGDDVIVTLKGKSYTGYETLKGAAGLELVTTGSVLHASITPEIVNTKNNVKVKGTSDGDVIINSGDNVTIESGGGKDTIYGSIFNEQFNFSSADGNNLVIGFDENDTLRATAGKIENVTKLGDDVVVELRGTKYAGRVTLEGAGSLADYITVNDKKNLLTVDKVGELVNRSDGVKFGGTSGREWMTNVGERVSIQSGAGDDTMTGSDLYGDVFLVASDQGNNIITNFNANDTLRTTVGKLNDWKTVGDDVLVTVKGTSFMAVETLLGAAGLEFKKSGSNLIVSNVTTKSNSKDKTTFKGTSGDDWLTNSGSGMTISSGAGNDTIEGSDEYGEMFLVASNHGDDVILNFRSNDTLKCTAGSIASFETVGNDVFVSLKGSKFSGSVTLKDAAGLELQKSGSYLTAKSGVNIISNDRDSIKVVGTSGDDWIVNSGAKVSIEGKGGQDTIEAGNLPEVFLFSSADDNNVIVGFDVEDSIKMTAGKTITFETVGADVVVTLKGANYKGIETLQGAAGLNFATKGKVLYVDNPAAPILNQDDGKKVSGTDKAEKIMNTGENVTVEAKGGDDTIYGSDVYGEVFTFAASNGGDNIIVNFHENDTLRATGGKIASNVIQGNDCLITITGTNKAKATILLKDVSKNGFSVSGDKTILRMFDKSKPGSSSEAPAAEDGYWFLDDETTADSIGDVDAMLAEVDSDNALGKLSLNDPSDLLMSVDGSARSDRILTTFARHRNLNK